MSKSSIIEAVSSIDWEQLRAQKRWLLGVAQELSRKSRGKINIAESADGIINMIDALQDAAVADGIASEETVFNLLVEGGKTVQNTYLEGKYVCKHCGSVQVSFDQGVGDAYCANCGQWQNDASPDNELSVEDRLKTSLTAMVAAYTGYLTVPDAKKALFNARNLLDELKS